MTVVVNQTTTMDDMVIIIISSIRDAETRSGTVVTTRTVITIMQQDARIITDEDMDEISIDKRNHNQSLN
jgi:type IV secretory pathway ATPase VirB11/archaellum biosynthesis ATPase